jgi:putative transposase
MAKFMHKYRVESARVNWWNYGNPGAYFITICTKDKEHLFGEIKNGKMHYTAVGAMAHVLWYQIPFHGISVLLGAFQVMPNHIHGIIILQSDNPSFSEIMKDDTEAAKRFQNQGKNTLSSLIGSYKSAVSRFAHQLGFDFEWQEKFHDRIIRDDAEYQRINDYIERNVEKWEEDGFYK